jgi:hypothetical protein
MDELVGWVLRNARTHAENPAHRRQTWIANGNARHPKVHPAQVGRWEAGKIRLTTPLVRRYEELLGYPEGTLLCAADLLHRRRGLVRSEPSVPDSDDPVDLTEVQALLEKAMSTERMSGMDWYRLSGRLGRNATAVLLERDWRALFHRCTQEMAVSLDLEFALRDESMARLAGHPRSGPVVARMAAEVLADPHAQVYNDVVSLLMFTDHADAFAVLRSQLRAPTNNDALRSALIVVTAAVRADTLQSDAGRADRVRADAVRADKSRDAQLANPRRDPRPPLTGEDLREVAGLCLQYVRDEARPLMVRRQAANVLRVLALPADQRQRLAVRLSADDLRYAATIVLEGRAMERQRLKLLGSRIREAVLDERHGTSLDPVLDSIVRTSVEDSDDVARSHSLGVLMLLPQRRTVAKVVSRAIADLLQHDDDDDDDDDEVALQECLDVLMWLAVPDELDDVLPMLLDPATRPEIVLSCGIVVGNAQDPDQARSARRRAMIHSRASEIVDGTVPAGDGSAEHTRLALRGLVYALGIAGRFDLVEWLRVRADRQPDPQIRDVAVGVCDWWLSLPSHVRPLGAG